MPCTESGFRHCVSGRSSGGRHSGSAAGSAAGPPPGDDGSAGPWGAGTDRPSGAGHRDEITGRGSQSQRGADAVGDSDSDCSLPPFDRFPHKREQGRRSPPAVADVGPARVRLPHPASWTLLPETPMSCRWARPASSHRPRRCLPRATQEVAIGRGCQVMAGPTSHPRRTTASISFRSSQRSPSTATVLEIAPNWKTMLSRAPSP